MNWNEFRGNAERLDDLDIPRIAQTIMVGEDELHAFLDVEANGRGFDAMGRPTMLFEPHVFWRNLSGAQRSRAVAEGLAYPKWRRNYPKDSYPRLLKAIAINEEAALRSASWGIGQILGENAVSLGYVSAKSMVQAFMDSEADQLEAIIKFLKVNHLDDDLRRHSWQSLADGYNGPASRANNYAAKLAAAYARWQKIKDTPWTPGTPADVPPIVVGGIDHYPVLRNGDGISRNLKLRKYVAKAQERLTAWGVFDGDIDGKFGGITERSVRIFQQTHGLTVDGVIGSEETWPLLMKSAISATEETEETVQQPGLSQKKGAGEADSLE